MQKIHPDWSNWQLTCCLYWQPKARKMLAIEIEKFRLIHPDFIIIKVPEATGINLTETMKRIGEILEWPPLTKTYQIAIAGKKQDICPHNWPKMIHSNSEVECLNCNQIIGKKE